MGNDSTNSIIRQFGTSEIRSVWVPEEEDWYFSVVDVVAVLTEQPTYDGARNYWRVLKKRLKEEKERKKAEDALLEKKDN